MAKCVTFLSAATAGLLLAAGAASAQSFPAAIIGQWTIRANNTQPFTFSVQAQSSDTPCAQITGLFGAPNDPIIGYYCPLTGVVSFLRNSAQTGATYQVFSGQVSWKGTGGAPTRMAGSFTNYAGSGDTGAYGFTASLPHQ